MVAMSLKSPFLLIPFFFFFTGITAMENSNQFSSTDPPPPDELGHGSPSEERTTHLHFYFHDIMGGPNPTAVQVAAAAASNASATRFGMVVMIDNPLTEGHELSSKLVGRAQGLYASASRESFALLMAMSFAFLEGEYNGSTLAVVGRNEAFAGVREMPVVGGSGVFRLARGYALARTYQLTPRAAVVEYDVFVLHY